MNHIIIPTTTEDELRALIEDAVRESFIKFSGIPAEPTTTGYYTRKEVAGLLKITLPTLRQHTKQGILTSYQIGKRVLYLASEVEKVVTSKKIVKWRRNGK